MRASDDHGPVCLGFIGGSGLYDVEGLSGARWEKVHTPFGEPSDQLLQGELGGTAVIFLPRHGRGHRIPPAEVNYRANIAALKQLGATDVIALSAVGSLREDLEPGTFVIVDQFVDRTAGRPRSFFGTGLVAHVSMAAPVCARLGDALYAAALHAGAKCVRGGTSVTIEGPQFSTRAESAQYRAASSAVIGMTSMPEARLAREAELCYGTVAMVTDWDCWKQDVAEVTVEQILATMAGNIATARAMIPTIVARLRDRPAVCPHRCDRALDGALMTASHARDPAMLERLRCIAGRVL